MAQPLAFLVDKITHSIEERTTGNNFITEILFVTQKEIAGVHKKDGWFFNWKTEFREKHRQVYKLVLEGEQTIEGLISLEPVSEQLYIEMHLIENAPHNYGSQKKYLGVAANLVAFACKLSFEMGFEGFVAFTAKTSLVQHYIDTLGAQVIYG